MTSDGWLKMVLETLVYRGGRINSSDCRGIIVGNEDNSCCMGFWCGVGMDIPDSAVDEENIGI